MSALVDWIGNALTRWTTSSYPFPPGSQNRDGFERNADNPLRCMNDEAILRLSAVWACVRLLAETISTLPLNVYETMPDGARRFASDLPIYSILHNQPNADMTAQAFWEAYVSAMLMQGGGYAEKLKVGTRIVGLDLLVTQHVAWDGEKKAYRYTDANGKWRWIAQDDVFYTPGFTLDGKTGLSAISYGALVFQSALSADTAARSTFARGMMPTVGFSMERVLTKAQRKEFRGEFERTVAGALNAGKPFLLEGGMAPHAIGINPNDAQLLESRSWSVEEICRWFRVPPHMVGHTEKTTSWGTGIEQQMIGFLTFALRPWLKRIEGSIWKNVFGPERSRLTAEFAIEGLLRADSAGRAALYASGGQNGWMTRAEMRALENLPFVEGSDVLTVQANLVPLDQLGKMPPRPTAPAPGEPVPEGVPA